MARGERIGLHHVESGTGDAALRKRGGECVRIDVPPAGDVEEKRRGFHESELPSADGPDQSTFVS